VLLRRRLLEDAGGTRESVLLLYAGRVSPEKNPRLLIDSLAHLIHGRYQSHGVRRDYRLVIAGNGPALTGLLERAGQIVPGHVHAIGAIQDRGELARLYASCDVFVHPNPREPFGIGPLEAMASRVPVVVPSAGGVLSYATAKNSWLAAPDAASFSFAIREAVSSPDPGRVAAAYETARQFDWSSVTARMFSLYDALYRKHVLDFSLPTTVSHRFVTRLGQSALRPCDRLRAAPGGIEGREAR
jgi:alpha-1,6-mannosyltransferase